jgi:hypothetical protein
MTLYFVIKELGIKFMSNLMPWILNLGGQENSEDSPH